MPSRGVVILGAASSVARAIGAEFAARGTPLLLADYDTEEAENNARDLATREGVQGTARCVKRAVADAEKQLETALEAAE